MYEKWGECWIFRTEHLLALVASGLKSSISKQKISIDGKEIGYAGAKLKGNGNSYMVFAVIQDKT